MRTLAAAMLGTLAAGAPALAQAPTAATPAPPQAAAAGPTAVLLQQAQHWQDQNRPDLALRAFERVLAVDPRNIAALAGAAEAQLALGNRAEAEALRTRLRALPGAASLPAAQDALRRASVDRDAIEDARRLSRDGRVPEALTRYRDAFGGGPPPDSYAVEYWLTLAGTEGGWDDARRQLADFAARRPTDARARVAAAQVLTWREPTRAQGMAQLAELARQPATAAAALAAWRQALQWVGDGPQAEAALAAYLAVQPNDAAIERRLAALRDPARRAALIGGTERQEGFQRLEANRLPDAARAFESALARNPLDADALGGLGVVRLREGRVAEARTLLERAIAADPSRAASWRQALDGASYAQELAEGRALLRRGELDAAEATLRRAVAREATDRSDAEVALGEIALRRNDPAAAEQRFRAALARRPGFQPATQGLERALRQQGRVAEADQLARQLRVDTPSQASGANRLRTEAARAADTTTQVALLRDALAQAPDDPWVRLDLARALARQGSGLEARALMDGLLAQPNPSADALFAGALFAEEQGRPAEASALLGRIPAGRRSPEMARMAQRMRALAEVEEAALPGGFEARQRLLALAARPDPTGSTPAAVVRAFARMGDPRGAEDAARVALAVNRTPSAAARLALAGALLEAGAEAQASALARGVEADPNATPETRRQVAALAAGAAVRAADRANEAGDQAAGFDRLRPVLASAPDDTAANLALARLYQGARQPQQAQRIADSVLARDPRNLDARSGAVDAAIAARDWRRAEALIEEGRALAPNAAQVSLMQARLARARGDGRAALVAARQAEEQRRAQIGDLVPTSAFAFSGAGTNPFRTVDVNVGGSGLRDPLSAEIGREIDAARDLAATRIGVAPQLRARSGTAGLDRLGALSMPIEGSFAPGSIGGRVTATVTPVTITSGQFQSDLFSLTSFGTNPLAYPTGMLPPRDDSATGVGLNVGYRREWLAADIGSTPIGFRFPTVVGGIELAPAIGDGWRIRLVGERRAVEDSLLSWSGQRDSLTGQTWGGVVRTGGRAQVEYAQGAGSLYAGLGYSVFDGSGVSSNARVEAGAGGTYAVIRRPDERLNLGLDLVYFGYDENLRFFTLGQGGYFSPQSYVAVNLPLDWRARSGDWSWRLGGSLGYAVWSEDSSPVFPNDPSLQAQLVARAATTPGLVATYASQSQNGVIGSLRADLEYALTRDLIAGALLRYDRAADWNEALAGVFLRYQIPN